MAFFVGLGWGFERLNATRTSVARCGLTQRNLNFRVSENADESLILCQQKRYPYGWRFLLALDGGVERLNADELFVL